MIMRARRFVDAPQSLQNGPVRLGGFLVRQAPSWWHARPPYRIGQGEARLTVELTALFPPKIQRMMCGGVRQRQSLPGNQVGAELKLQALGHRPHRRVLPSQFKDGLDSLRQVKARNRSGRVVHSSIGCGFRPERLGASTITYS